MTSKTMIVVISCCTALNLFILGANISLKVRAEVAGMDSSELRSDSDFRRAVKRIVEDCHVVGTDISC